MARRVSAAELFAMHGDKAASELTMYHVQFYASSAITWDNWEQALAECIVLRPAAGSYAIVPNDAGLGTSRSRKAPIRMAIIYWEQRGGNVYFIDPSVPDREARIAEIDRARGRASA